MGYDVETGQPTAVESQHSFVNVPNPECESKSPMKPVDSMNMADSLVWIFSDKAGLRQRIFQSHRHRTLHFHHDLHSRLQCQRLLNELSLQSPMLLWIRLAGPCAGSGNKHDACRAEHLVRLINQQKASGRHVVVDASERSQVWNLQAVRECVASLFSTTHQWCN